MLFALAFILHTFLRPMTYSSHVIKEILTFGHGYGVIVRNINFIDWNKFTSKEATLNKPRFSAARFR